MKNIKTTLAGILGGIVIFFQEPSIKSATIALVIAIVGSFSKDSKE